MIQATAQDLRFHSKELLDTVNRGEEVVITYRGKPCAKLVPNINMRQSKVQSKMNYLVSGKIMIKPKTLKTT